MTHDADISGTSLPQGEPSELLIALESTEIEPIEAVHRRPSFDEGSLKAPLEVAELTSCEHGNHGHASIVKVFGKATDTAAKDYKMTGGLRPSCHSGMLNVIHLTNLLETIPSRNCEVFCPIPKHT